MPMIVDTLQSTDQAAVDAQVDSGASEATGTSADAPFEQWAILELFGHQRIAGLLTEQVIGGCSFVRVDVPAVKETPPFTKLYGQGAIYAISLVDEPIARAIAERLRERPVSVYELPELKLEAPADHGYEDEDEDVDDDDCLP